MAYPWVKLYTEMIHDPKIGRLSEHLQLVFVKLLCATGEYDDSRAGLLPPVDELAWTLRTDDEVLTADLDALESAGLVMRDGDAWIVTRFAARQGPMTTTERSQAFRERQRKRNYYDVPESQSCNEDATKGCTDKIRLDVDVDVDVAAPGADAPARNDDDDGSDPLTAQFFTGLHHLGVLVSSQMQAEAYQDVVARIRGHPQADAFIAQLFSEAAATTSGRITPRWFEVVVDRCIREGRLPGERQQRDGPRNGDARAAPSVDWDAVQAAVGGGRE